jgi:NitT/TauT family transport system substrate-binding protein
MMRRTGFLTLGAAAAADAAGFRPAFAQTADVASLRIAAPVADDATPLLYAESVGITKRAGLDLTVDRAASGAAVAAGVAGGSYAIGHTNCVTLLTAHAKGLPFVFVAPAGIYEASAPVTALLVRSDSAIHTAADLNGKTLASSSLGDLYTLSARNWMDLHGGDSSTLKTVELPSSAVPAAFEAGRIDAGGLQEPALSVALATGKVRVLSHMHDSIARRFMISGWFTTLDYATQNRAIVDRFRSVLIAGSNYANAHHAATVDMLATWAQMDPKVVAGGTRVVYGIKLDPQLIQPVIDLCVKYKTIAQTFDARDVIDPAVR